MSEKNVRSRNFGMILYPDDEKCERILEEIKAYDYCYILHDRDLDKKGVLKKPHYHVILKFKQARWLTAISKELDYSMNYFQQIRSEESMMEYLIHFNDEDKFQYSIDDIKGTLKNKCKQVVNKDGKDECDKVKEIIGFIKSNHNYIYTATLAEWCADNGYWDVYRRGASIINNILREHNLRYTDRSVADVTAFINMPVDIEN